MEKDTIKENIIGSIIMFVTISLVTIISILYIEKIKKSNTETKQENCCKELSKAYWEGDKLILEFK